MAKTTHSQFSQTYRQLLNDLVCSPHEELNKRTGSRIKLLLGGQSFKISLANGRLPVVGNRAYFPHIAAAETAWQLMGTKDPAFILKHAPKLWSKFVEQENGMDVLKTCLLYTSDAADE